MMNFNSLTAMKRSIILGAVALLAAVACNKEAQAPVSAPEGRQVVVSAQREADTKVIFENDKDFIWGGTNDVIGMYVYSETDPTYNPWIAPFNLVSGAYSSKATFAGTLGEGVDYGYVAIYPYVQGEVMSSFDLAKGVINLYLPPYYTNLSDTPDGLYAARMPMAAKLDMEGDKSSLAFKNIGGLVKVILKDVPSTARYFKLWAKSGGNISGPFSIVPDDIGTGYIGNEGDGNTVELQVAEGISLPSEIGLCFPVPCGTFVFGIGVYDDNGYKFEKDGSAENTISRGTILKMPAISLNEQPEQPGFPQNPPSGYCLIGEFGSYMWDHDVVMEAVPGNSMWYVAKNIAASANGQISFKYRADTEWTSQFGAAKAFAKQLNTLIALKANDSGSANITLVGTGTYDVYFSPLMEQCFILTAGSAFAVPTDWEEEPELPAGTSAWSIVGMVGGGNNWSSTAYHLKTKEGSGWHYLTNVSIQGEFKFRKDDDWAVNFGSAGSSTETVTLGSVFSGANNGPNLKTPSSGNFDVYLNPDQWKAYIVAAGGAAPAEL